MQTQITNRWQTVIPSAIRKSYQMNIGDALVWIDDGITIRVVPITSQPIKALRGSGRGLQLTAALMAKRADERARDE